MPRSPFRRLFRLPWRSRGQIRSEVEEEIRFHLEMRAEELTRQGLSPAEASARARREFGDLDDARRSLRAEDEARARAVRRTEWLGGVGQDLRFSLRALRRTPALAIGTLATLVLGIGITTTVFTLVNGVLLRPLPVADPGRLVSLQVVGENGEPRGSVSLHDFEDYRRATAGVLAGLAAQHLSDVTLSTGDEARAGLGVDVSENYFAVLGIRPAAGRFFGAGEADARQEVPVAVISHELWTSRFGGDADAIGEEIRINGQPLTVVGVAPEGFHGTMRGARPLVWLPLGLYSRLHPDGDPLTRGRMTWLQLVGRLRADRGPEDVEAAMGVTARQLAAAYEYPEGEAPVAARVDRLSGLPAQGKVAIAGLMALLLATAGLVLLIALVNVAAMLVTRALSRSRELAIRVAIGAGRGRLIRMMVAEGLLLALVGGVGGVLLALFARDRMATVRVPFAGEIRLDLPLDARVLAFALGVSVLAGVFAGLGPALHAIRSDPLSALKQGSPGAGRPSRSRRMLVGGQLALSVLLLITAGLFVRTLQAAWRIDLGIEPEGVLVLEMDLGLNGYDEARGADFYEALLERIGAIPGVEAAAVAGGVPLGPSWEQTRLRVPGHGPPPDQPGYPAGYNAVTPEFFESLRIPLLAGRGFTDADRAGRERVLVVNETFARRFWPGGSAVGERVTFGNEEARIVGVVPDGKYRNLSEDPIIFAYLPFAQQPSLGAYLHVRARGDVAPVLAAVRRELREMDPHVPPIAVNTMDQVVGSSLFAQRMAAGLVGSFGLVGMFLAAVGVFGVLSFSVAQRTREIGVRMALGASRRSVLRLVLRDAGGILGAGLGAGLLAALLATRLLAGMLHGLDPADPVTFGAVALLMGAVALLAAALPARRATRIDPMVALRTD